MFWVPSGQSSIREDELGFSVLLKLIKLSLYSKTNHMSKYALFILGSRQWVLIIPLLCPYFKLENVWCKINKSGMITNVTKWHRN